MKTALLCFVWCVALPGCALLSPNGAFAPYFSDPAEYEPQVSRMACSAEPTIADVQAANRLWVSLGASYGTFTDESLCFSRVSFGRGGARYLEVFCYDRHGPGNFSEAGWWKFHASRQDTSIRYELIDSYVQYF